MKKNVIFVILTFVGALFTATAVLGQDEASRQVIRQAMRAELDRSMSQLSLPGLKKPFLISYHLRDVETTSIRATLGALVSAVGRHFRDQDVDVLVGDYFRNTLNFREMSGSFGGRMFIGGGAGGEVPLENDATGIRTALWLATDERYKQMAEFYERKMSAMQQQKLTEETAALPDLTRELPVVVVEPPQRISVDKPRWESTVRELSAVFRDFPDIQDSSALAYFFQADVYLITSEGVETVTPLNLAVVAINYSAQAEDGTPLKDSLVFLAGTPAGLPPVEAMKTRLGEAARQFVDLIKAPLFDGTYTGPVLFEEQAVGELFSQRFFSGVMPGFLASRKPVYSDPQSAVMASRQGEKSLEEKIETRVLPKGFSVKATPGLAEYQGVPLIGTFRVDAEGVAPPESLSLVENGILKSLLNGRVPTPRCPKSNGHLRPVLDPSGWIEAVGPGVISVESAGEAPAAGMKDELLRLAREAGLKTAYIVRKLNVPSLEKRDLEDLLSGLMMRLGNEATEDKLSDPVYVYKVDVSSGKEVLVRGCILAGMPLSAMRHIAGADAQRFAYNTLTQSSSGGQSGLLGALFGSGGGGWRPSGILASFVVPKAVLFEELDLKKESRTSTPRLPVVPSPLKK